MNNVTVIPHTHLDDQIEKHRKYLLKESGGEELKLENIVIEGYDFSGKDCENAQFINCIFRYEHSWHEGEDDYGNSVQISPNGIYSFKYTNFSNVNFTSSKFEGKIDLDSTILKNAVFINVDWTGLGLKNSQKQEIITTVSQLTNKLKNQEVVIGEKDEQIVAKNERLEQTSKEQSKGMLNIFDELRQDFSFEERLWISFSFFAFLILFTLATILLSTISVFIATFANFALVISILFILQVVTQDKKKSKISFPESFIYILVALMVFMPSLYFINEISVKLFGFGIVGFRILETITLESLEVLSPISVILFSVLWFSVHQYGRAKKLRIEQQNKQAMIHFMQAIMAHDGKRSNEDKIFPQLAPFFANAIIHRPFSQENYDPQLPIDEVFKIAKEVKDIVK